MRGTHDARSVTQTSESTRNQLSLVVFIGQIASCSVANRVIFLDYAVEIAHFYFWNKIIVMSLWSQGGIQGSDPGVRSRGEIQESDPGVRSRGQIQGSDPWRRDPGQEPRGECSDSA